MENTESSTGYLQEILEEMDIREIMFEFLRNMFVLQLEKHKDF